MCTFITATIDANVGLERLKPVFQAHRFQFLPLENPGVQRQLPKGRAYLVRACGVCDCGTAIGRGESAETNLSLEIGKLRRQGWSQVRIDRWVASKRSSAEDRASREQARVDKELSRYLEMIRAVLEVSRFGLMHHFYAGSVGDEVFEVSVARPVVPTVDALLQLPADTLQEFGLGVPTGDRPSSE